MKPGQVRWAYAGAARRLSKMGPGMMYHVQYKRNFVAKSPTKLPNTTLCSTILKISERILKIGMNGWMGGWMVGWMDE